MRRFLCSAAAFAALTGAAAAADMPQTYMAPEPMAPAPIATWSGAYVGGFVGYSFRGDNDGRSILFDTNLNGVFGNTVPGGPTGNAFAPGFCDGTANGATPAAGCDDDDGSFIGSIRLGYDFQFGSIVVGPVLEASFFDMEENTTAFSVTPTFYTIQRDLNFLAAGRLRAGFATPRVLVYATGGAAYGDIDYSFTTGNGVNSFTVREDDEDQWGYQLGAGAEVKVTDNVSLSLEYLYTSFDDDSGRVRAAGGTNGVTFRAVNSSGTDFALADDDFDMHTVHVGVNYRF